MIKKFSPEKITNLLILILFGTLLIFGGLGINALLAAQIGLVLGFLIILWVYLKNHKIEFPRGSLLYLIFLFFFAASVLWADQKSLIWQNFLLFLVGGVFWLGFHNLGQKFKKIFFWLVIFLGAVFGMLFLAEQVLPGNALKPYTLYLPVGFQRNHNHLGDLWALTLIALTYLFVKERKWWNLPLGVLGIYFLGVSLSRSAYASLLVGLTYLFYQFGWLKKFKSIFLALLAITAGLFLYAGSLKSVLSSRPYFVQAIRGLSKYPFGVGVGNFSVISTDPQIAGEGAKHFSSLTHNLILEITTGLGIFGFVFIAWLIFIVKDLLSSKRGGETGVFEAIFFALLANFMFDYTYVIPTMLWLWFTMLGLAQAGNLFPALTQNNKEP
ncbi:hypothetical protein A2V56_04110 [Candidatus Woesebacteria bacterium RBG_19FT_COMBO_42_9]|uniref:O-antigen polymerase n=1 Tax=Candidatus Woesebacteria bacterium RBG_16_42_24 TaxID=1802485 RepID=A0A1F7XJM1_9BACT|nr:MAG: hypothetical protein A2V97_01255 [Candidatus Woesebacteria bacterium RBG_16_42_24]OGM17804.1 MAG: hypothetical protein A2V56_04110 [Candidatus Woesebacteria bacterium RBG_19FT_COMBO_42_9]OGM68080.1 MAG: hypothetical protein A2985_03350 [Candidatus Woesebacteria bacterium RIFCSPLOWO2_01_FULL_43_11]